MNKTTKGLSFAIMMVAMTGMTGITFDQAYAAGNGAGGVGNGGFQLNLVGKDKSTENSCTNNGHRIFVPLSGQYRILLTEGSFGVIDCNALDSDKTASFRLPDPTDLDGDGVTDPGLGCEGTTCDIGYQVFVRVLGQPGKNVNIGPTCATEAIDADGDGINEEYVCSTETINVPSANGKQSGGAKFTNVSKQLLTLCIDLDGDGDCDRRIALFDDDYVDYLWNFDNNGARLTQLRFIIEPTTIN